MKNLFYTILAFLLALPATSAHAVVLEGGGGGTTGGGTGGSPIKLPNPLQAKSFEELLESILNLLLFFAAPIYALMVVIAVYYFIFGGQSPANRQKAINIFKYATIGLFILLLSRAIVALVQAIL